MELRIATPGTWLNAVLQDFNAFLLDHASNERKASASALTFVVRYPDKTELIEPLIQLAREELTHFHRVYKWIAARGLTFQKDTKDPYLNAIRKAMSHAPEDDLLHRLLIAGVVEARGCERFRMVGEGIDDAELSKFYLELAHSESRHASLFEDLARLHYAEDKVANHLSALLEHEAQIIQELPIRAALH